MERFGDTFKKVNLDDFLGPITVSKLLKNKCFLLTCTIPIKVVNGTTLNNERHVSISESNPKANITLGESKLHSSPQSRKTNYII